MGPDFHFGYMNDTFGIDENALISRITNSQCVLRARRIAHELRTHPMLTRPAGWLILSE